MNPRPRLKSHVQPLRRGPGSLQLGLSPGFGVVLDGLSDAEVALVEHLDGSLDTSALYAVAADAGVANGRVSALITTLAEHHLLVEITPGQARLPQANEPRRHLLAGDARAIAAAYDLPGDGNNHVAERSAQHVVISGEGELPGALADLLRVGGIGRVSVGPNAVNMIDLELRDHWAAGASDRLGPMLMQPDLVVLAAMGAIPPDAGTPWLRRGIPHLPLVVQGHRVQVGPLITGDHGPCLMCLDLHRRDRDAAWPALLSQLAPGGPHLPHAPVSLESSLTAMTAGAAAMIVHTCLDGHLAPDGLSLELSLPWPTIQIRQWFPHPLCGCTAEQATMGW
ncbi:MAG: hypothetical protein ABI662_06575 [Dermatophilaceae bacterium]